MPARKYSDETLTRAAEMREQGMTYAAIAKQLGMNQGSVRWHCLRLGADCPPDQRRPQCAARRNNEYARGNHTVRSFTEAEDAKLIEMDIAGLRVCEMARNLSRKPNSIRGRLMTLARHQEREFENETT